MTTVWTKQRISSLLESNDTAIERALIDVASEFSRFPAGRFRTDGPYSGERFREELLVPALSGSLSVTVTLDGTMGYGSSFLEEAFGGLVRVCGFQASDLRKKLKVVSSHDPSLETEAWLYIDQTIVHARPSQS